MSQTRCPKSTRLSLGCLWKVLGQVFHHPGPPNCQYASFGHTQTGKRQAKVFPSKSPLVLIVVVVRRIAHPVVQGCQAQDRVGAIGVLNRVSGKPITTHTQLQSTTAQERQMPRLQALQAFGLFAGQGAHTSLGKGR